MVVAYASIYGSPKGSTGTAKVAADETFSGSSAFCVVDLAYIEFGTASGDGYSGYIGIPDQESKTFYNAGEYVDSYIKSLCDGATASVGAHINGYCILSHETVQTLHTLPSNQR